ncbi:TPA: ead/Ea22-like family protein [Enterobacter cloacae]
MSNIDKQALRDIAAAAESAPLWHAVGIFGEVVDPAKPEWKPVHDFCKTFTAERVLALLDELEAETSYREGAFIACNRWHDKFRESESKLEAAEKRIAELEARTVTLPAQKYCPGEYAGSVLWGETEVWNQAISECAKAIRAAGIGKGE